MHLPRRSLSLGGHASQPRWLLSPRDDATPDDNTRVRNAVIIAIGVVLGLTTIITLIYLHLRTKRLDKAEVENDQFDRADYGLDELPPMPTKGGSKKGSAKNGRSYLEPTLSGRNSPKGGSTQRLSTQNLVDPAADPFSDMAPMSTPPMRKGEFPQGNML